MYVSKHYSQDSSLLKDNVQCFYSLVLELQSLLADKRTLKVDHNHTCICVTMHVNCVATSCVHVIHMAHNELHKM